MTIQCLTYLTRIEFSRYNSYTYGKRPIRKQHLRNRVDALFQVWVSCVTLEVITGIRKATIADVYHETCRREHVRPPAFADRVPRDDGLRGCAG